MLRLLLGLHGKASETEGNAAPDACVSKRARRRELGEIPQCIGHVVEKVNNTVGFQGSQWGP